MEHEDISKKVIDVLQEQLDIEREKIKMDSAIIDDLGADSVDVVDVVQTLEGEFNLQFSNSDIEGLRTVSDIVNFIEEHDNN